MLSKLPFTGYSLRGRLLVWVLLIYVACLSVVLLLIPIIDSKLQSFNETSTYYIERAKEVEGTNYARLIVLELARLKELLQVSPGPVSAADQSITDLLWEKITFNPALDGIELIQADKDEDGQHVTFLFYRRPPGQKPMPGPQKIMKGLSGPEEELIDSIDKRQQVDHKILGTINYGPKKEGEMMFRYFPVHVLTPRLGAVYWGVAKIGINTNWVRKTLADERRHQEQLRHILRLEILFILFISAILFMMLTYLFPWVRRLMEPLSQLVAVSADLDEVHRPQEFTLWLENLKRFDPKDQAEVAELHHILWRLGSSLPRLGQRLAAGEGHACLGKIMGRSLPAMQTLSARLQTLVDQGAGQEEPSGPVLQEMRDILDNLQVGFEDLQRFWPGGSVVWQRLDLAPGLASAWRLVQSRLPVGAVAKLDIQPLPKVWGSPVDLLLAVLYLLDALTEHLEPGGRLELRAAPSPAAGVQIALEALGAGTAAEWQEWLSPWQGHGEVRVHLGPSLAAAIVAQHGGALTVQAQDKGGVILSVDLPPMVAADASHKSVT
jgi:signal transduction histidine kinase